MKLKIRAMSLVWGFIGAWLGFLATTGIAMFINLECAVFEEAFQVYYCLGESWRLGIAISALIHGMLFQWKAMSYLSSREDRPKRPINLPAETKEEE